MVSALGYERSEPGFESRATGVRFYFHAPKKEEKSAVPRQLHLQPLVTITPERGPAITTITHGQYIYIYISHIPHLNTWQLKLFLKIAKIIIIIAERSSRKTLMRRYIAQQKKQSRLSSDPIYLRQFA